MSIYRRHAVQVSSSDLPLLIFVHGLACDQNVWGYIAPRFERTHRVVLYDLMGCGRSQISDFNPVKYGSLEGHVADFLALCEALDHGPATVVGHSMGGMIALLAAAKAPSAIARLALLNTSACYRNIGNYQGGLDEADIKSMVARIADDLPAWSAHMAPMVLSGVNNPCLVEELQGLYCRNDGRILVQQADVALHADVRDVVGEVVQPVDLFHAHDDIFVTQSAAEYLRDTLPCATSSTLLASGHYPHLSDPEIVTAVLRAVLTDLR